MALGVLNLQIRSGSSYTYNATGVRETSGRFVKDMRVSDPATVFLPPAGRVRSTGHSGQSQRSDDGVGPPLRGSRDRSPLREEAQDRRFPFAFGNVTFLHAAEEDAYEAPVLFDPVICPPRSGRQERLRSAAGPMADRALRWQSRFSDWQELAQIYPQSKSFQRLSPEAVDLVAQTALRTIAGGTEFELCCPPNSESQMLSAICESSIIINLEALRCPVKVIGADPLTPFSFLPATDPNLTAKVGYGFMPENTHYLPLEEPQERAALLTDFIGTMQKDAAKARAALPAGKAHLQHDFTLGDVEEALRLVDLEQRRLLGMLSGYLDAVRRADDLKKPREAARALLDRLEESLDELAAYGSTHEAAERDSLMARQKLLGWLEQQIAELCQLLRILPSCPPLDNLSAALVEGIDVVLLVLVDTVESGDAAAWAAHDPIDR